MTFTNMTTIILNQGWKKQGNLAASELRGPNSSIFTAS